MASSGSADRASQESRHFLDRSNVEFSYRANLLQPIPHRCAGVEQLELNAIVVGPSLQTHEHA